jgi:hypothetical protein
MARPREPWNIRPANKRASVTASIKARSRRKRRILAKAAVAVYEAAVENDDLLADQVFEGVQSAKFGFDLASRFALLDPDFAKLHDPSSKCSFRLDLNERLSLQLKQASICATTLTGSVSCRLDWTRRVGSLETQKGERVTHGMRRIAQEMCDEQRSWLNDANDANDALFRTTAGDSHEVSLEDSRLAERVHDLASGRLVPRFG